VKIFELRDNKIEISPEILLIKEFKDVWDSDKDKGKINAYNQFKYVYLTADPNSAYYNFPDDRRKSFVALECFNKESYKESTELITCIEKYKELTETSLQRMLKAVQNKIDDAADFLNRTKYTDQTQRSINDTVKNLANFVDQEEKLKNAIEKEKSSKTNKRRGGKGTNLFEE
jgi:hypothetical protein